MEDIKEVLDADQFQETWDRLSEEEKIGFLEQSMDLEPNLAILPVLNGMASYHFNVRNLARKGLERIQSRIKQACDVSRGSSAFEQDVKLSEAVCTRICAQVRPDMPLNDMSYFVKVLFEFENTGPYFAFNLLYKGTISVPDMGKIIGPLPESAKLAFVDPYLCARPGIRLKFAPLFRRILSSVTKREEVIRFYADLFDRKKDADPFLFNLDPELRDPDRIVENEIRSQSPEIKIMGLKALSMIVNKIDTDLLLDILLNEPVKKVRLTIYAIIENSTLGAYSEVFHPVLELFYKCDEDEGLHLFRALAVSGKLPLYELLEMVRENFESLLPGIKKEISSLSKISFLVIQDIALNKERYLHSNFTFNLACVLGMIKKRPERVVRILKKYDNDSRDVLRMNVTRFIKRTKDLMAREKTDIETEFDGVIETVKQVSKKNQGLLSNLFSNRVEKKIARLKTDPGSEPIAFYEDLIHDIDFSGFRFLKSNLYFTRAIVHGCDFSGSSFAGSGFRKAVFYDVDMEGARFEMVDFDHAVFINVNAKSSRFNQCSFQKISMYNCNFNDARFSDVSFIGSTLSKSSFNRTSLLCSSFAFSKISAVSFVTANLDQVDFSYVKARFCRLPSSLKARVRTDHTEYNVRTFQLSFSDMPQMDPVVVKDIDILTFSEFIHYGERKFLKQNRLSQLTAFDIFKPRQADLFQIIPLLLHIHIEFPGLEQVDRLTPAGISDFVPDTESIEILKKYLPNIRIEPGLKPAPYIEGLFTIGSVGSVAQTSDSDIDYWVCINEEKYTPNDIKLLDEKLAQLEKMALGQFETQVTFFRVDILKAKNNDFGDSTVESSGSAQTRILKEEFYRTMIHVAGKIPLWAVLPTSISVHYYNTILEHMGDLPNLIRYIDLGDIHAISTREYFGASIWQMFKWLNSPFKSAIKMALLEKYIDEYGRETLLCNKYKDEWMNSGEHLKLAQNDSYYILLNNLLLYYRRSNDNESIRLLLTCFFLKLEVSTQADIDNTVFGLRKILLDKCMEKWGWGKQKIFEIGSFKTWSYTEITTLSMTIEKYMIKKYKTVNRSFESLFHGRSQISPEDRTVLGRKVFIEFSKQPGKVQKVLLISRGDRHFHGLHLKYSNPTNTAGHWELINKYPGMHYRRDEHLTKAKTIEEIGAWLINNGLYNEGTIINLVPNPTYVTHDDIRKLFKAMYEYFAPQVNDVIGFDQLLVKSRITRLLISINFYAPRQQRKVTEYTAVYLNSWGEMYCKSVYLKEGFTDMEAAKADMMERIGVSSLPKKTAFYFSKGLAR
ncbi:MAG: class I adenylate cyclase [Desulfobacterales bacterium]|nr:class I adenylate cyclase [Desulfobacterales bacterium]